MKLSLILLMALVTTINTAFAISGDVFRQYEVQNQLEKIALKKRTPGSIDGEEHRNYHHGHTKKNNQWKQYHKSARPKNYHRGKNSLKN